jgi:hypothetical protein
MIGWSLYATRFMLRFLHLVRPRNAAVTKTKAHLGVPGIVSSRNEDVLSSEHLEMDEDFNSDMMSSYYHQGGLNSNAPSPSQTNLNKLFDQYRG